MLMKQNVNNDVTKDSPTGVLVLQYCAMMSCCFVTFVDVKIGTEITEIQILSSSLWDIGRGHTENFIMVKCTLQW